MGGETAEVRHAKTIQRETQISEQIPLTTMWECRWEALKRTDADVQAFMATYEEPLHINPRDALTGGRVNAAKLYHATMEGEKVHYYDFTSLYPSVMSKCLYPTGAPELIFDNFDSLDDYFGFIRCKITPPRGLFHPVLPFRYQGKLLFPLCRTCVETQQVTPCTHTDIERQLSATWTTPELQKAVSVGYTLDEIERVWHFPSSSNGLFKDYMQRFLKLKQEASGYPPGVVTDVEKDEYIRDYLANEGVALDKDAILYNPALRLVSKLCMNSTWGKFCEREERTTTEIVGSQSRFSQLMFSDQYRVSQFAFLSPKVAVVTYKNPDKTKSSECSNLFVGCFTTAYGRLALYNLLEKLGRRVIYYDTDSVIFSEREGEWMPPTGPYLGDLTSELAADDFIVEFVSLGPKSYAYRTHRKHSQVKCKGVTLNARNSAVVTFDTMSALVRGFVEKTEVTPLTTSIATIKRNKKTFTLHNATLSRKLQVVYTKRIPLPDFTTLPYGF